jgi:hypothetical protein
MNPRERPAVDPVERDIACVLDAERAAQDSIAAALAAAQSRVSSARAQARQIAERAEARVARARQSVESGIALRKAQVDARINALRADAALPSTDDERIDQAVAAVAAALTTGARK